MEQIGYFIFLIIVIIASIIILKKESNSKNLDIYNIFWIVTSANGILYAIKDITKLK